MPEIYNKMSVRYVTRDMRVLCVSPRVSKASQSRVRSLFNERCHNPLDHFCQYSECWLHDEVNKSCRKREPCQIITLYPLFVRFKNWKSLDDLRLDQQCQMKTKLYETASVKQVSHNCFSFI